MIEAQGIRSWSDIPGFFRWVDRWVFATLLGAQRDSPLGTMVELGTYQAKSAVIIGAYIRPGERFIALDLFGREDLLDDSPSSRINRNENREQYTNLTRQQFERNYLALHDSLPEVHEGLSTDIVHLVEPNSARFVHVDAGHMYDQVRQDVINTKTILRPGGIVAFDDYRTEWTPGVSAAVWEAVFCDGLIPVAITPQKMYGVYEGNDPEPYREALKAFVVNDPDKWWMQEQYVLGRPLLRIKHKQQPSSSTVAQQQATRSAATAPKVLKMGSTNVPGGDTTAGKAKAAGDKSKPGPAAASPPSKQESKVRHVVRKVAPSRLSHWVRDWRDAVRGRGWAPPTKR